MAIGVVSPVVSEVTPRNAEAMLDEQHATQVARVFHGVPWSPMPGIWLAVFTREDGCIIVMDAVSICEYADLQRFEDGEQSIVINLS